ncbi:unnamed protein product [Trichogramma brassicae]|uniref:RNA-directed DNA polymerase n=1 Tax=Trichogramma brassicae TaxID=86971 RepID=A0A6H5IK32_9HYME|nr:unnamed protein product [Trichogramma brassicae]
MANQGRAPLAQWEELRNALTGIRPVTPSFEGLDHEDPEEYLRKCEAFFTRARIDEDQKVPTLQQALRGEARKWWAPFEFLDLPFEEFQRLVRARWNDTGEKGRLLAKLYGNQQKPNESTTVFIQQKLQLFKRLMPEEKRTRKRRHKPVRRSLRTPQSSHLAVTFRDAGIAKVGIITRTAHKHQNKAEIGKRRTGRSRGSDFCQPHIGSATIGDARLLLTRVEVRGAETIAALDSGATHNYVKPHLVKGPASTGPQPHGPGSHGSYSRTHRPNKEMTFQARGQSFTIEAFVMPRARQDVVLGTHLPTRREGSHRLQPIGAALWSRKKDYPLPDGTRATTNKRSTSAKNRFPAELKPQVDKVLRDFEHVLMPGPGRLVGTKTIQHEIHLTNPRPFPTDPLPLQRRQTHRNREAGAGEMLANGVIEPSNSPYNSPIVLAKKKGGQWRFCIDFRRLNELTVDTAQQIPGSAMLSKISAKRPSSVHLISRVAIGRSPWRRRPENTPPSPHRREELINSESCRHSRTKNISCRRTLAVAAWELCSSNSQKERGRRIIAYASAKFSVTEEKYHCNEQECLAVVWAIKRFRPYLEDRPFILRTDSRTVTWLNRFKGTRDKLMRWALLLQEFQFTLEHCPGRHNELPDHLSRNPCEETPEDLGDTERILPPTPKVVEEEEQGPCIGQAATVDLRDMIHDAQRNDPHPPDLNHERGYRKQGELIWGRPRKGTPWRLYVPTAIRPELLRQYHDSAEAGHPGSDETHRALQRHFYWRGMQQDVRSHIRDCNLCGRVKKASSHPAPISSHTHQPSHGSMWHWT